MFDAIASFIRLRKSSVTSLRCEVNTQLTKSTASTDSMLRVSVETLATMFVMIEQNIDKGVRK